jgi:hypothetical protein
VYIACIPDSNHDDYQSGVFAASPAREFFNSGETKLAGEKRKIVRTRT